MLSLTVGVNEADVELAHEHEQDLCRAGVGVNGAGYIIRATVKEGYKIQPPAKPKLRATGSPYI